MSRVSVLVVTLVALTLAGTAPAQDKEKVLQTVQKLESRLAQIDRYFRGHQTSEAGAIQAEIVSMQQALAATRGRFVQEIQDLTARAEGAEQALRAQAAKAADTLAAAEVRTRTAEDQAARLTAELADAILAGQAGQREREALVQRAEDASASLAAEQDRVAELEYQLQDLRAQLAQPPGAAVTPTSLQIPTPQGIEIHVHGGEATFYINGDGLRLIQPPSTATDLPGDPDLRLRLRRDSVPDRIPPVTPKTLPPRIHFP